MSDALKKQIVLGLLGLLAAWPLLAIGWTAATGNAPAHAAGWTSYERPWRAPMLVLWKKVGGAWRPVIGEDLDLGARLVVMDAVWRASMNPSGKRPDKLGESLLKQAPGASAVRVEMRRPRIDPATAQLEIDVDLYDYE